MFREESRGCHIWLSSQIRQHFLPFSWSWEIPRTRQEQLCSCLIFGIWPHLLPVDFNPVLLL